MLMMLAVVVGFCRGGPAGAHDAGGGCGFGLGDGQLMLIMLAVVVGLGSGRAS